MGELATSAAGPGISFEGPARNAMERSLRWLWGALMAALVAVVAALAWLVAAGELYAPGSDLGYNLGLVGGLMMLTLLLYPLRKRVRAFENAGTMQGWFRYHMVLGIVGPVLVLFHSTFRAHSMNASVALYSMLLVVMSGVVGRFVYRHVHQGLYGQRLTLEAAEQALHEGMERMHNAFGARPDIERRLEEFRKGATAELDGAGRRLWRFMSLRLHGRRLAASLRQELKAALRLQAREQGWSRQQLALNYGLARQQLLAYVETVCQTSQLASWERIFALWHVVHVPFIYLLVISGIIHVVAVHMY